MNDRTKHGNGDKPDVADEIRTVERRIALHREQLKRHAHDAKQVAARRARPLPILALLALAGVGFAVARASRPRNGLRDAYVHAYRPVGAGMWRPTTVEVVRPRRASTLGKVAALTGAALRLGMSPQARLLWDAIRRRRARHA